MSIDLFSPQVRQDPYPAYAELRRKAPIHHDTRRNLWLVGRYADVARVLSEPEIFSSRGTSGENLLLGADPPIHTRVRGVVKRAFKSAHIAALTPIIRSVAQEAVERAAVRGKFELIEELAVPLPLSAIACMLGVDLARLDDLRRWAAARFRMGAAQLSAQEQRKAVQEIFECRTFLADNIRRAAREGTGGCIVECFLGSDTSNRLTLAEMLDVELLLLIAATETTTNLIGNAVLLLARDSSLQAQLRANAGLITPFIEEVLRYDSPIQRRSRVTTRSTQVAGVRLPEGARVEVLIGSANRDPENVSRPDQFQIERRPNRHLSFGLGSHFCLGAQLAKLECSIALETLLRRLPHFVQAEPARRVEYGGVPAVRGPRRLELALASPDAQHRPPTKEVVRS